MLSEMPPWLVLWLGLIAAAIILNGALKIDGWITSKLNPTRDSRKASLWVWAIFVVVIGGGGFWIFTHPSNGSGGNYEVDPWEYARR